MNLVAKRHRPLFGAILYLSGATLTSVLTVTVSPAQSASVTLPTQERRLAKAEELIRLGDIAAARLVLEHILEEGSGASGAAAFRLAETYDPRWLSARGVVGWRGDPKRARELYGQAYGNGIKEAEERLAILPR